MFDGEDETGVHARVQTRSGRPAGEQRPAADAGRGRAWDPALDVAAVACHAERSFTPAAAIRIDGDSATQPGPQPAGAIGTSRPSLVASPSDQAAEIARLRRELDRTRMERDVLKKAIGIFAEMPK